MVVTFLEMTERPPPSIQAAPREKIALMRVEKPSAHFYRYLYDAVGNKYFWVDRKKIDDAALDLILSAPSLELYVLYVGGAPAGMAEIDFHKPGIAQLAYFGLIEEAIGRGLGHFFLSQTVSLCWNRPIHKILVNTCTLDHPRALPLYQRMGFKACGREDRYIELL